MPHNQHAINQLRECQQIVNSLMQQTQQATAMYQQMLQREQQNAQQLELLAQREREAVHMIQMALQGHQTAMQGMQQAAQICSQMEQYVVNTVNELQTIQQQSFRQQGYGTNSGYVNSQYGNH